MKLVNVKLQVRHYAQIPCVPFCVDVKDEAEAFRISHILAQQHLFLYEKRLIPDFANHIAVVMWDEDMQEWTNYWNEEEFMEWDEFVRAYFDEREILATNIEGA